jgi:hypothetical protein
MTRIASLADHCKKGLLLAHPCQGYGGHRQECLCYLDLEDVAFAGDHFVQDRVDEEAE